MNHYFECTCGSNEHTICLTTEEADGNFPPELFFHFQLSQPSGFLGRLWKGLKYIFGAKCKYGHWDVVELSQEDVGKLTELLLQYKEKLSTYKV